MLYASRQCCCFSADSNSMSVSYIWLFITESFMYAFAHTAFHCFNHSLSKYVLEESKEQERMRRERTHHHVILCWDVLCAPPRGEAIQYWQHSKGLENTWKSWKWKSFQSLLRVIYCNNCYPLQGISWFCSCSDTTYIRVGIWIIINWYWYQISEPWSLMSNWFVYTHPTSTTLCVTLHLTR